MTLYRDNANTVPVRPPQPDMAAPFVVPSVHRPPPWAFRTREDFPELMNRWGLTGVGVEVGTYRGGFATHLLKHWDGVLHVVDPWTFQPEHRDLLNTADIGGNEVIARNELSGWVDEGRCVIHKGFSTNVAAYGGICDPIDWVYIDALHDYANCLADLTAWAPLVRSGGVLAGHDYLDHPTGPNTVTEFGVVSAVRDWCAANGYDVATDVLTTTDDGYPTFVIRLR